MLPRASHADPERQQYEPDVQPERPALDVKPIVAELVSPRHVARGVDLRDSSEARLNGSAFEVAVNLFDVDDLPAASGLDLTRHQRSRADEAHVAPEDVDELGQL